MTSEDNSKETPEQKIQRLAQAVGQTLGIERITQMQEEQAQKLDGLIRELGNTNQNMVKIFAWIEQVSQPQPQTTTIGSATVPPQGTVDPLAGMMQDPTMKVELIKGLAQSIGELIRAIKGNSGTPSTPSPFAQLGEQMVTDLIRATVDDVQQRVYNIRKLPPPGINAVGHGVE